MKKIVGFCFLIMIVFSGFAIEVDRPEIDTIKDRSLEFINYTGTHDRVDSVQTIRGIGSALGSAAKTGRSGDLNRYAVIHCVDPSVKEGLDADIFIIGRNAGVDHIDNVRLMIAGYLSAAYGYSQKDAATIAHFVTIYNAVYRNQMSFFNRKYKAVVTNNLTEGKAGIALRYSEWAGNTQIIIPLSDPKYAGTVSTVDTKTISDKKVIDKMREESDKDIGARKDMVDLKEKESAAARDRAKNKQKEAAAKQKAADKKQKEADSKQKTADKKQKEAEKARQKAEQSGDAKAKEAADKKQREAEKAQAEADKKQKEAEKAQTEVEQKKEEAKEENEFADQKSDEAQSDRKDIAADTQRIIEDKKAEKKAESDAIIASAIPGYGLKVIDTDKFLSKLVLLDLKTEAELRTSSIDTIRGRTLYLAGNNLLAIAGSKSGNAVIALVLIDPRSLEIVKQSNENIAAESLLVKNGNDYYAVIDSNGTYYLGRFNEKLEIQARSAVQVLPYTPITIGDKGLLVQDSKNAIRLLRLTDLTNIVVTENSGK